MKIHGTNRKSGFTIMELLVAMMATAILALIVGLMLVYGWQGWHQNTASVEMQRDATLAMQVIAKEIRRTPMAGITPGTNLVCRIASETVTISKNGGDLLMTRDTGTPMTLVRGVVTYFNTSTNAIGSVQVDLNLDTGIDKSSIRTNNVIYSRN